MVLAPRLRRPPHPRLPPQALVQGTLRAPHSGRVLRPLYPELPEPRGGHRSSQQTSRYQSPGPSLSHSIFTGNAN